MTQFDVLLRSLNPFHSHLLEASAGTGKTFAIEHLAVRLLLESDHPCLIEEILIVTFTRASTRELKRRIHRNLKHIQSELERGSSSIDYVQALCERGEKKRALERIEAALICFDRAPIHTLHGFCYRLLKEFALEARLSPHLPDPDEGDRSLAMEKWTRHFLKQEKNLSLFSPMQLRGVLKRHGGDIAQLIRSLSALGKSRTRLAPFASHSELFKQFCSALEALAFLERGKIIEDFETLIPRYVGMGSEWRGQLYLLSEILSSKKCSFSQFEALLKEESILEGMREERAKKRAKPLQEFTLHYPSLLPQLRSTLLPLLLQVQDAKLTFLNLAREVQLRSREREESFSPDDLLVKAKEALSSELFLKKARGKFRAAIIDEFQDTDPLQWSIIKTLFLEKEGATLHLVGDPKQSIYAFRHADLYVYLDAVSQMKRRADLKVNYRSTPKLVSALNHLFSLVSSRWLSLPKVAAHLDIPSVEAGARVPALDEKPAVEFFVAVDKRGRSHKFPTSSFLQERVYPYIASQICTLRETHNVAHHEIALLVKDRFQGQELLSFLQERGIPAHMQGGRSLAESEALLSLKELMKALYTPTSWRLLRAALVTPLIGGNEERLAKEELLLAAKNHVLQLRRILFEKGFGPFLEALFETKWEGAETLVHSLFSRGEKRLYFDLKRLCEWVAEEERKGSVDYLGLLSTLFVDGGGEDPRLHAASAEGGDAVCILTLHRSKGLEFDVVFALGLASRHPPSDLISLRGG